MRNIIIRFFPNLLKRKANVDEEVKDTSVLINKEIDGDSPVYSLVLEKIPYGKIEDSLVPPAVLIHTKVIGEPPVYALPTNREFIIGRNSDNDLCLIGEDISNVHVKIRPEKNDYVLYSLSSVSEVHVNWKRVSKHKLKHRDRIKIGSHILVFEFVKEEEIFDGIERRKTVRVQPVMTVEFLVNSDNKLEEYKGIVKDISLDGARIEIEKGLHKGTVIEAGISSSELPLIEVIAQVIWERFINKDDKMLYDVGLQFLEMDEKSRKRLKDHLSKTIS